MKQKLITFFTAHVKLTAYVLAFFVTVRLIELLYVHFVYEQPVDLDLFFSRSLNFDLLVVMLYSIFSGILLAALSIYKEKLAINIDKILAFLFCFINIALTHYFLTTNSLLTSQFFEFSASDLSKIISSEFTAERSPLWIMTLVLLIIISVLMIKDPLAKRKLHKLVIILYGVIGMISLINIPHTHKDVKYFASNYQYQLGNSKMAYFIKSYLVAREKEQDFKNFLPSQVKENANVFQAAFPNRKFTNVNFPFMHEDTDQNVLGPYFPVTAQRPNIVLIISESLSALVSGNSTAFGSLTPFTDSLMSILYPMPIDLTVLYQIFLLRLRRA